MTQKKKVATPVALPSATLSLADIKAKFARLKEIRTQLEVVTSTLRAESDRITEEMLPLFFEVQADRIIIHREIGVGTEKIRFTPYFYDEKKGKVLSKAWKSTCFPTGTIN